jgi:hypothetical protein
MPEQGAAEKVLEQACPIYAGTYDDGIYIGVAHCLGYNRPQIPPKLLLCPEMCPADWPFAPSIYDHMS